VAVCGPHIEPDVITKYSEAAAREGALGLLRGAEFMDLVMGKTQIGAGARK